MKDATARSASPNTLFQSTHAGGPSFEAYRAPSASPYTLDAAGRLTSLLDANQGVTRFTYDPADNLASLTDPVGNITEWSYDDQDRLTQETNALGDSRDYVYDAAGDLVRYIDRNGAVRQYEYDAEHRVIGETWYAAVADADAAQNAQNTIEYAYDSAGRLIWEADDLSSVSYVYDEAGRLSTHNAGEPRRPGGHALRRL